MKVLDQQRQETTDLPEAETLTTEALIKEARRRQRLRWLSIGVAALLFVLAGVVLATHFGLRPRNRSRQRAQPKAREQSARHRN